MTTAVAVAKKRAICHPGRIAVTDSGLCRSCFIENMRETSPTNRDLRALRGTLVEAHKDATRIKRLSAEADAILKENLPEYADLHMEAARIAAADGDARPAEWALTHIHGVTDAPLVKPPAKSADAPNVGMRVLIGVQVGNLPDQGLSAQVIEMEPVEEE